MLNWILTKDKEGKVGYLMKQKDCNVTGKVEFDSAIRMLKRGTVRVTDEFEEYPLTSDGVYYFAGEYDEEERPVIGADGLPIPAGGDSGKKRRKTKKGAE